MAEVTQTGPPGAGTEARSASAGLRCDFCGELVASVRRVALDRDYDRLRKHHRELYACPPCSDRKEQQRLGLARR